MLKWILNYRIEEGDNIYLKSINRRLNGITFAFFLIAAMSAVMPLLSGYLPLFIIQLVSALFYLSVFIMVRANRKTAASIFLISVFELQIFSISLFFHFHVESFFNFTYSPEFIIYIVYPVLAAVLNLSILLHAFISVLQIVLIQIFSAIFIETELNIIPIEYLDASNLSLIFYALLVIIILVSMLINENSRLKQESIQRNLELSELNQMKDRMFAVISHDMRSYLGSIEGVSKLLMNENLTEAKRNLLTATLNETAIVSSKLLENLLFWASNQLNNTALEPQQLSLGEIISDCIEENQSLIRAKALAIDNNIPQEFQIHADSSLMRIVFRNLLTNAVKFSYHGGKVEFNAENTKGECFIKVKDYGIGIEGKKLADLFKFNPKKSTAGTKNEKGFGLGMVICSELVNRHGGTITAESVKGEFTEFTIRIPI